jgi:hypothetical protein
MLSLYHRYSAAVQIQVGRFRKRQRDITLQTYMELTISPPGIPQMAADQTSF